jgi:hypothetical protein
MHNHPGYTRKTTDIAEGYQARAYEEGWIDGVEIVNSTTLYPQTIRRCIERGLFMAANTDAHKPTSNVWSADRDFFRTMTFVMAKSCTEKDIKEALKKGLTIGYTANNLMGEQTLLAKFLNGAIFCCVTAENNDKKLRTYTLTNNCSVPFILKRGKSVHTLRPFQSLLINISRNEDTDEFYPPVFDVLNMFTAGDKHPSLTFTIDK